MSYRYKVLFFLLGLTFTTSIAFSYISIRTNLLLINESLITEKSWLGRYSHTFLDDLKVGRLLNVERKLKALLNDNMYESIKLQYGEKEYSFKHSSNRRDSPVRLISLLNFDKTYEVEVRDSYGTIWGRLTLEFSNNYLWGLITKSLFELLWVLVGFISITIGCSLLISESLTSPIKRLTQKLTSGAKMKGHEGDEIRLLDQTISKYFLELKRTQELEAEQKSSKRINAIASQVVHDIRSPLAALSSIQNYLIGTPEDVRVIFRESLNRINDISNTLSLKNLNEELSRVQKVHIYGLLDRIISEKRMEYQNDVHLEYEAEEELGVSGLFVEIDVVEFKRVLSNLINNAIESYPPAVKNKVVKISLSKENSQCFISITDSGRGIPPSLLDVLGKEQITYNKSKGTGLGLKHAFNVIKESNGKIIIIPQKQGTTVRIELPLIITPQWYVSQLQLKSSVKDLYIIDDDTVIHGIWRRRFKSFSDEIRLHHFYSPESFLENSEFTTLLQDDKAMILCDFEFHHSKMDGINLYEKLGSSKNFVLVTSYFDDLNVIKRVETKEIKLLPKFLAADVNITTY
jgi:signal transduction histidine kinase